MKKGRDRSRQGGRQPHKPRNGGRGGRGAPRHFRPARDARPPRREPSRAPVIDDRFRREHQPASGPPAHERPQVEGRRAVLEALRAGVEIKRVRFAKTPEPSPTLAAILEEARARRVLAETVEPEALDAMSQTGRHQGVIAEIVLPKELTLEALLERTAASGVPPFFVVLDGVEDPQNLGAIARSAEAAGATALILPERHSAHVSPGSLRASAGAILLLPVAVVPNTARCLEALKAMGIWVAGADQGGEKAYHQASLDGPLALVIGGEHKGLHRLVRERCDFLVNVPLRGRVESLNASAAAAVLLFEIARQREARVAPPNGAPRKP